MHLIKVNQKIWRRLKFVWYWMSNLSKDKLSAVDKRLFLKNWNWNVCVFFNFSPLVDCIDTHSQHFLYRSKDTWICNEWLKISHKVKRNVFETNWILNSIYNKNVQLNIWMKRNWQYKNQRLIKIKSEFAWNNQHPCGQPENDE